MKRVLIMWKAFLPGSIVLGGVSTSTAFHRNWSVSSVLEAAAWRSNSVFAALYLRDLQFEYENIRSLSLLRGGGGTDHLALTFYRL